jgi:hypothetical protein
MHAVPLRILALALALPLLTQLAGCNMSERVLIVSLEDSRDDSYGMDLFRKALERGGQVAITVEEIRDSDPDFEANYAISRNGSYFKMGATINYITSHGWTFYSREFGGLIFKK